MNGPILSRKVSLADLHGAAAIDVTATPDERAAMAGAYDLLEVSSLSATVTVTPEAGGALNVAGRVTADISQPCVVTLDPVAQHIDESVTVRFVRPGSPELPAPTRRHDEMVVDPAAPDPPEVLTGPVIDLGALVEEAFVLGIDPYPRSPGAVLAEEGRASEERDSPFAVLAGLKARKS